MMQKNVFTGIKPTGKIHIGNYVGAIKPALALAGNDKYKSLFFIADYHGLTKNHDPAEMRELTYEVAAAWIALGLNIDHTIFYRQSDVPEIFELSWILSCFAPKGLMNRAHAFKAAAQTNKSEGKEPDYGVSMGLYTYPILMASDILLFQSDLVPVGKDQIQHVEIARDIAQSFNHQYGKSFILPEALVTDNSQIIPGLDGRKMSKSYNNTIPLFSHPEVLRKLIYRIKTDSSLPGEPKNSNNSTLFSIYRHFASPAEVEYMDKKFEKGISWGEVKQQLFEAINSFIEEPRQKFEYLMEKTHLLEEILEKGAKKARDTAIPALLEIKKKIGIQT
ncbi:tryptophan--tRNA ligase [Peribacillus sp. SCS-155]|uniref:tryptophan--tRNA ligase n=1 Tax=Peribacillus sedimenti TaxID=3115297 RepID=UPI0039064E95